MTRVDIDHLLMAAIRAMILLVSAVLFAFLLTGCSWIESDAGKARYTYTVTLPDGTTHEIDLRNAKDIGLISAKVTRLDDGTVEVELIEQGVSASDPMRVMAETQAKMIDALLAPVP